MKPQTIRLSPLLLLLPLLLSCASGRYMSGISAEQLGSIALVQPNSHQSYIDRDGNMGYNDSLSWRSVDLLTEQLMQSHLQIPQWIATTDGEIEEVWAFMDAVADHKTRRLADLPTSVVIDSLLIAHGYRYGLLVCANGFSRSNRNYGLSVATGVIVGVLTAVLTLGTYVYMPLPNKGSSHIYAAIVDAQERRVVFYNRNTPDEAEPLEPKTLRKQINTLFKDFK